ncbi:hypothetical protein BDZ97DRAFT_1903514 [Flammula alnicola]|nr:hypothetical protein BDZ97DRAFT_1903514 [Flammula alnicola]
MKRPALTLVSYSSSDDESAAYEPSTEEEPVQQPPPKKKKLPPISSSIVAPGPMDNPTLHQGRIRTTPHVEGQFAAHVYVSLALPRQSVLHKVVRDILRDAKKAIPTLHDIWSYKEGSMRPELHISLSRPIFLRAHQREDLKRAVKNIAKKHRAFIVFFATLSELINDEKTRTFLTMEIGAGYHELRSLLDELAPALQAIRQQEYYVNPRFHASIAWALLCKAQGTSDSRSVTSDSICTPFVSSEELGDPSSRSTPEAPSTVVFPTIARLPPEEIKVLNDRYSAELSSPKVGAFDVGSITLKIGKDVSSWRLIGM